MATTNKAIPIIIAGVAVLAVIAYFGMDNPPRDGDIAGTIAPAERYRADQLTADDVELGDQEVQMFMQTDLFAKLTSDETLRNAFASEAVRDAFANKAVRDAFASEAVRNAFASEGVRNAFASEAVRNAFSSDAIGSMSRDQKN